MESTVIYIMPPGKWKLKLTPNGRKGYYITPLHKASGIKFSGLQHTVLEMNQLRYLNLIGYYEDPLNPTGPLRRLSQSRTVQDCRQGGVFRKSIFNTAVQTPG